MLLFIFSCTKEEIQIPTLELFGENSLSTELPEFMLTMNMAENKAYFNRMDKNRVALDLYFTTKKDDEWTTAVKVSLFEHEERIVDPFLTFDEQYLFFSSNALESELDQKDDYNIWYVKITDNQYSQPVFATELNDPNSSDIYTTLTKDNHIIFSSERRGDKKRDLFLSKFDGASFSEPERVFIPGTRNQRLGNPGISPDGNLIVFSALLDETVGGYDLYITQRNENEWSDAKNLGEPINSKYTEFTPVFSKDGQWLYFTSERPGVATGIADGDRPPGDFYRYPVSEILKKFKSIHSLKF